MDSASLRLRALKALPGGITRSTVFVPPHPPYAVRGEGCKVMDVDGHQVIDVNNNYTSLIHGHAHPALTRVATATILTGSAFGIPTPSEIDLAELLGTRTGLENWRFCNSGTEAVMMAIRCARAFTKRDIIVRFEGSYHGTYDAVVDSEAPGILDSVADSVVVLPQGDAGALKALMASRGKDVAAVLIDLMPNRAGLTPARPDFIELIRQLTTANDALLIIDEVITFRIATGGLSSTYGVKPDIMTVGKIIGGGFAAGGMGGAKEVLEAFLPTGAGKVSWGGTFSANPVTMNCGRMALELFDAEAIRELNQRGDDLRKLLNTSKVPTNGFGSLLRLPLAAKEDWWELYSHGVLICTNGLMALSTAMTEADLGKVGKVIVETLARKNSA